MKKSAFLALLILTSSCSSQQTTSVNEHEPPAPIIPEDQKVPFSALLEAFQSHCLDTYDDARINRISPEDYDPSGYSKTSTKRQLTLNGKTVTLSTGQYDIVYEIIGDGKGLPTHTFTCTVSGFVDDPNPTVLTTALFGDEKIPPPTTDFLNETRWSFPHREKPSFINLSPQRAYQSLVTTETAECPFGSDCVKSHWEPSFETTDVRLEVYIR